MIGHQTLISLIFIILLSGCTSAQPTIMEQYSEVPDNCQVVDTFRIFSTSKAEVQRDLRHRSFKALTTSRVDKYLVDIDIAATGFVISDEEYQRNDVTLQARREFEDENSGAIVDWAETGYLVPDDMKSFVGVFVTCPRPDIADDKYLKLPLGFTGSPGL